MNIVLTIAGSDSGGGAGIQADLKTFQELNVFGTTVITALTAQNTLGVNGIYPATPEFVELQLNAIFDDFDVRALKTGMLFSAEIIQTVARNLKDRNLRIVVDPVMIAKGGQALLKDDAVQALIRVLLPIATVLTPNIPEAETITGMKIQTGEEIRKAAQKILEFGVECVVMKGGHLEDPMAVDTVFFQDGSSFQMKSPKIDTRHTHGTGCTFSAAITAYLGRGLSIKESIIEAKKFVQAAIENPLNIGHGHGPTNHFAHRLGAKAEVEIIE
ncbi:bifunctional hydroxymethylpyrimidine kinase/phosphomethylpyrimidine kinase [Ureibacillus sp. FSL K6-8385]|uniref:Hydroxymethylpyrimidine/phosphomethylpyrimidine kinase n=1 Tax=Ureibacillus terrenus TaxID=118246 RepID=A0A540V5X7_9BACL|nr:bifunctional hydroxymethylpyrimidine kinase/phosphomethylpyrimidine kinase [Ureibacillus terrenus]MED3660853.1 bifunctional hydroxymethylpyrimidine kinase/phosphomethylpyrimidine kinase [Ureibacillus terrenus]TQE92164.1 bifunctional hydroxymethylpyrimidine kinase/phosphomethylpyrimidine kinase [Ureibacillus terrenus]